MANGVLFDAPTMLEYGRPSVEQPTFFWQNGNQGIGITLPPSRKLRQLRWR